MAVLLVPLRVIAFGLDQVRLVAILQVSSSNVAPDDLVLLHLVLKLILLALTVDLPVGGCNLTLQDVAHRRIRVDTALLDLDPGLHLDHVTHVERWLLLATPVLEVPAFEDTRLVADCVAIVA